LKSIGKTVLIVDDEPDVLTYLTAVLENADYIVHGADSAAVGLESCRKVRPDLVCLDIMMPGSSGMSLYAALRADAVTKDIPVLIISGAAQAGEFDFRSYVPDRSIPPPDGYLEKPIQIEGFLGVVGRLIESQRRRSAKSDSHA